MNEESSPPSKRQKLDETESDVEKLQEHGTYEAEDFTSDKFDNFVRPEEVEKLREFTVLDEVKSNDEDSDDEESDDDDGKSEGVPEEEIEKMLEEDLPEDFKGAPKPKEKPYITRQKTVLEEKGVNQFEVLPLDWMMVRHYSGMPVYMHRGTRVCTLAKPYSLGKGNTRRHDIPISAIPCLAYRRALEEEEKQKEIDAKIREQIESGTWTKTSDKTSQNTENDKHYEPSEHSQNNENEKPSENSQNEETSSVNNEIATEELAVRIGNSLEEIEIKQEFTMDIEEEGGCPFKRGKENSIANDLGNENDGRANEGANGRDVSDINKDGEGIPFNRQPVVLPGGIVMPPPRVETVNTSWKTQQLTHEQVNEYCKSLFKFKTVNIMHFKRWADRRKYAKARKTLQYPTLPAGTKLITIPAPPAENGGKASKRDWVMNMNGRSYLSVFHEYVRRALQKQPVYEFKQLENASSPYQATVYIGGMQYGCGRGSSKRQAKAAAARASIHILIPEMRAELDQAPQDPDFTVSILASSENASSPYQATVYIGGMQYGCGRGSSKRQAKAAAARASIHILIPEMRAELDQAPQDPDFTVSILASSENASSPYQATVYIGGMQYGCGRGSSKRQAKAAAARASIHILIPEMRAELDQAPQDPDFTFFDYVGIEDPRISEFCAATCEPSPHAILRTCLLRNFGAQDRHINTEMKKLEYQKIELTMRVGRHSATVVCKNKKAAKQRASQAILQALHPHVRSWGSLLRLYGSRSVKSCKEKKLEEQQITLLQDQARHNEPNYAVLEKLRHEMLKLKETDAAVVPLGTLLLRDDLPTHSGSNLNNVDL